LLGLGRFLQDHGRLTDADAAFRRATGLLELLVTGGSGTPRRRELLAIAQMSHALLLRTRGQMTEAEQVLRNSIACYQALAADFPDRPDYRGGVARANCNLGDLFWLTGRLSEAETAFREAERRYEALVAADAPGASQNRIDLARCDNNLANLLASTNQVREAEAAYRSSLRILRELAATDAGVPQHRLQLGRSLGNFGILLADAGRKPEAEHAYRESQAIFQQLVDDHPDVPDYRSALAWGYASLASLDGLEAETDHRRGIDLYRTLVLELPNVREYRAGLVESLIDLAKYLKKKGRDTDVETVLREALPAAEETVRRCPDMPDCEAQLGKVLRMRGEIKQKAGAHEEARGLLERAGAQFRAALVKQPGQPEHRSGLREADLDLARVLVALGKTARTLDVANKLYGQAVVRLREAVAMGLTETDRLAEDDDLAPLSSRGDFRLLMMDLAFPAVPFAN
jgi:tetratricopeptide (TPR) repeat protein